MSEGAEIQFKPIRQAPGDYGFADDERVPVAFPDIDKASELSDDDAGRVRRQVIVRFLEWVTAGDQCAEQIGRRCLVLSYSLRLSSAPSDLTELADRLCVSKTRAWQIVQALKLNAKNGDFQGF